MNKNCHRRVFCRRLLAGALVGVPAAALAQTVDINAPGALATATGGTTPADGAIWNLNSPGIYSASTISMPAGPLGLTINGNGNTLTLNNSSTSPATVTPGRFTSNNASLTTLNLSDITITGSNSQALVGGAFEAGSTGGLAIHTSGTVRFADNLRNYLGGAIYVTSGGLSLATTGGDIYLSGNTARSGGAIYANGGLTLGNANGIVSITGNTTSTSHGGAIYSHGGITTITGRAIDLSNNHQLLVQDTNGVNTAADGGAINADSSVVINGPLTMNNNSVASPSGNGHGLGGGIYAGPGAGVNITVHGSVSADGNVASVSGGAFYSERGDVSLATVPGEGSVSLTNNQAGVGNGGAVRATNISIGNADGAVTIADNSAMGSTANGGALYGTAVTIAGSQIVATGNRTAGSGGAIDASGAVTLNSSGPLTLSDNGTATGNGGAIYAGGAVTLNLNGPSTISGNGAGNQGGAIYALNNVTLNSLGGDVTFIGNTQNTATAAQANAIYLATAGTTAIFNVGTGHTIAFYDPVAGPAAGTLINVNITGGGTVLFDGSQYASAAGRTSSIRANTQVQAGTLRVDNGAVYGATASTMTVQSGATLAGNGTVTGNTTIGNGGTLAPGGAASPGTLTINGDLALNGGSVLAYRFGEANRPGGPFNDLTQVNGNLTLDGTINVATAPGGIFDPGVYRVFNYTGGLTNNGLDIGVIPSPGFSVQTSVAHEVNLVNANGPLLNFWDGAAGPPNDGVVNGGDGPWQNSLGNSHWTTSLGTLNAPWAPAAFAVFEAVPGTVTVDNSLGQVTASGMQFAANGYRITGGPISLVETTPGSGQTIIRVGDGAADGAGYTATIDSILQGATQLAKHDLGTLVLAGINTYSGGTAIDGGTLQVSQDANLGAAGTGLSFDGGTLATTASFTTQRNATLEAAGGTFDVADGTTLGMDGVVSGTGALTKVNTGTLLLDRVNAYSGATNILGGTLRAGAVNAFSAASPVHVAAAGTLDLHGFHQTVASLGNAGLVDMGTGTAPGTLLTVTGGYVGEGGTVAFNTRLGADDSPTDRLVVSGPITGSSRIQVSNAGGGGALTQGNGIQLVQANGGSVANAFTLGNRAAAGAYEYLLFRGGVGADADNPNWYLRSAFDCSLDVAGCDGNGGNGGNGGGMVPPPVPIYRPEDVVDSTIPALASRFGLGMLGTWHERTGGEFATNYAPANGQQQAGWGRVFGDRGSYGGGFSGTLMERTQAFEQHGPSYDFSVSGFQAGMDVLRRDRDDKSRDLAGFYVGAGRASADIDSVINFGFGATAGHVSMDGYSLGGYYTHIGPSGWYVDTVLQGTRYEDIKASSNMIESQTLKTRGWGLLASVEGGYPIALNQAGLVFEPQAQLVYQHQSFNDGADAFGQIAFSDGNAWYGRLAARLSKDWTREDGRQVMAWARVGVWSDFGAQAKTTFSSLQGFNATTFGADLGGDWAQLDVGVSAQVNKNMSIFAVGDYNQSFHHGHSWGARGGVKVAW